MMQICKKCVLPETYPGIKFDEEGVCNFCNEHHQRGKEKQEELFSSEEELISSLQKYKDLKNDYDVLVPVSGGVDSCCALIKIRETFGLNPLVFHNDHGYEENTASENVKKLCKSLDVDLVIWQHDFEFMKKLWRFVIRSQVKGINICYVCGNMIYLNAVEMAHKFRIPLIINGYTKGMIPILSDKGTGREKFNELIGEMLALKDKSFLEKFMKKNERLNQQKMFLAKEDLESGIDPEKVLVIPFYIFNFYQSDKDVLKKVCVDRFDWKPIKTTYPGRTTNCQVNWLNAYIDLEKMNYTFYHDEYSSLIRVGELTREQALKDLEFNPPPGLIEQLTKEIGLDTDSQSEKTKKDFAQVIEDEGEFGF
jgi:hypothetical protein